MSMSEGTSSEDGLTELRRGSLSLLLNEVTVKPDRLEFELQPLPLSSCVTLDFCGFPL